LNMKTIEEIIRVFSWIKTQNEVMVVLIRGRGKSFCSGADLNWMLSSGMADYKTAYNETHILAKCFNLIYRSDKVIISLFHGDVFGGGLGFAGTSDFNLAAENTRFSLPELKLGLVPATIMPYLMTRLKLTDIKNHVYTGDIFSADQALKAGLIDYVCKDPEEMEIKALEIARSIMTSSPEALSEAKRLLRRLNKSLINKETINKTIKSLTKTKMSDDAIKRMTGFLLVKNGKITITNR
ncbi:MAG: enoyl-CoA hydratase/isomerase family protein, partial [Bacteroidia bacterium]|nr:enoyl-CoA hydratase/isomerase family protein [Bacteroidia bacterium]